jgi:predicted nucleotidyltransferase
MGRTTSPGLLSFFRSEALARVLAAVLLSDESLHLRAIATRSEQPYSVVQREIDRLEEAKIVTSTRFGTARVVRPNPEHPYYEELRSLVMKAYGPRAVIADVLDEVDAVDEAFLYGSWAARYSGERGETHADVDVVVVGNPQRDRIDLAEAEAEDRIGLRVQIAVVSPEEWVSRRSSFVRTVRSRPLVAIR